MLAAALRDPPQSVTPPPPAAAPHLLPLTDGYEKLLIQVLGYGETLKLAAKRSEAVAHNLKLHLGGAQCPHQFMTKACKCQSGNSKRLVRITVQPLLSDVRPPEDSLDQLRDPGTTVSRISKFFKKNTSVRIIVQPLLSDVMPPKGKTAFWISCGILILPYLALGTRISQLKKD